MSSTPTTEALAKFNDAFGNSFAADAYGRVMSCGDLAVFVALLSSDRARETWWEAHREDCEFGCRDES